MENTSRGLKKQLNTLRIRLIQYAIQLTNRKIIPALVIALIVIQALQLISLSLPTPIPLYSFGLQYFQYVAHVLYPDYYLRNTTVVLYSIPIIFFLQIIHIVLIIYTFSRKSRLNIIVHYLFLFNTSIFTIPFLTINVSVLACNEENPFSRNFICYQGFHIILIIFACVNIGWIVFSVFFVFLFYTNKNPFHFDYYSTTSNNWVLIKFVLKITPIIYTNINPNLSYAYLYTVTYAVLNAVYYAIKLLWPYCRSSSFTENWVTRSQIVVVFTTGFVNSYYFLTDDQNNIAFIMSILLGIFCSQLLINYSLQKQSGLIKQIFIDQNDEGQQIPQETYLQFFYSLLESIERNDPQHMHIFHVFKVHKIQCTVQSCPCNALQNQYLKNQKQGLTKQMLYRLISQMIHRISTARKSNNSQLKTLEAYILFYRLNQKVKSVFMMSNLLLNDKIAYSQQIAARRLFSDFKQANNQQTSLNKYVQFSQKVWNFEQYAENSARNCQKYWIQLSQQDCQVTKIWRLANIISKDKQNLSQIVNNQILKIFPNNLHTLNLYTQLLTLVYCAPDQQIQGYKIAIQAGLNQEIANLCKDNQIIFKQNEKVGVMCVGQLDENFQFLRVSNNIYQILSIRSRELVNKNINVLMPEVFYQFHDNKVRNYLNQTDSNIKQRNSYIFVLNGAGKLTKCMYKVKVIPSLKYGFELVSFIKQQKIDNTIGKLNYLMYYNVKDEYKNYEGRKKSGQIIHIDPWLQNWIGQKVQKNNQQGCQNVKDLFPEWDFSKSIMAQGSDNTFSSVFSIQLVHEVELNSRQSVKYLCVSMKYQKSFLSEHVFQDQLNIIQKYSLRTSQRQQNFQASISNIKTTPKYKLKQYKTPQTPKHSQQTRQLNPFSNFTINLVTFLFICLITILSILSFKLNDQYLQAQKNDFTTLRNMEYINTKIYQISLNIQKQRYKSFNSVANYANTSLSQLNNYALQIYEINTIKSLDTQISIPISIFVGDRLQKNTSYTFNNALSFLITAISTLFNNKLDATARNNLFFNIQNFYTNCLGIDKISFKLNQQNFKIIKNKENAYAFTQISIIFFVAFLLAIRIHMNNNYASFVLDFYTNKVDTTCLIDYASKCEKFLQNIRGNVTEAEKQAATFFFSGYQQPKPSSQAQPQQKSSNQLIKQEQQQQQQEKLISLRKKLTFQSQPSKIKQIILIFLILIIWGGIKIVVKIMMCKTFPDSDRIQKRNQINSYFDLDSQIQRLLFNLALKSTNQQNNFLNSLSDIQNNLLQISISEVAKNEINLQELAKSITILKSNKNFTFQEIQISIAQRKEEIISFASQRASQEYDSINGQQSLLYLTTNIGLCIFFLLLLRRLIIFQEQILNGSKLMLKMIKQQYSSPRNAKYIQNKQTISQLMGSPQNSLII